jgi:hypothetical protein
VLLVSGTGEFGDGTAIISSAVWNGITDAQFVFSLATTRQSIPACTLTPASPSDFCSTSAPGYLGFQIFNVDKLKCLGSGATNGQAR